MRLRTAGSLALTATLTVGAVIAHGQAAPAGTEGSHPSPLLVVSDDGLLTISVPAGAAPPATPIEAIFRAPDDIPPDLAGIETRGGFYQLLPADQHFEVPVRLTRTIQLDELGFDPATTGVPLVPLALRSVDGEWRWLEDLVQAYDLDSGAMTVSGTTTRFSATAGFGGTAFLDPSIEPAAPGSDHARFRILLEQPDGLGAELGGPSGVAWDPRVAQAGAAMVDGAMADVEFDCLTPASVPFSVTVPVDGIGGGLPFLDELGLPPASMDVVVGGTIDCPLAGPLAVGAGPKAIRGQAAFDSVLPNGVDYKEAVRFLRNRKSGRYDRMRMRTDQDVKTVHTGDDGVVWLLGGNQVYDEFYALRPGSRPDIIEGISGGGSPELFRKPAQMRRGLREGVDGHRVIDRAFDGKRIPDGVIRQAGGRPRELSFLHTVRIKLDTDSEHPADVILGVAESPSMELPVPPAAYVASVDPVTGRWIAASMPDGYVRPTFEFGDPGATPLIGDFDGDGTPGPATFDPTSGRLVARDSFSPGPPDIAVVIEGLAGLPLIGDFDGDGIDALGLLDSTTGDLRLFDVPRSGTLTANEMALHAIVDDWEFEPTDRVIVGDFDGDGSDRVGFERGGSFFIDDSLDSLDSPGFDSGVEAALQAFEGLKEDQLFFGDWDGDQRQTLASLDIDSGQFRSTRGFGDLAGLADEVFFADGFESGNTTAWSSNGR